MAAVKFVFRMSAREGERMRLSKDGGQAIAMVILCRHESKDKRMLTSFAAAFVAYVLAVCQYGCRSHACCKCDQTQSLSVGFFKPSAYGTYVCMFFFQCNCFLFFLLLFGFVCDLIRAVWAGYVLVFASSQFE